MKVFDHPFMQYVILIFGVAAGLAGLHLLLAYIGKMTKVSAITQANKLF